MSSPTRDGRKQWFYAVEHLLSGSITYHGKTEAKAAEANDPGTVCGQGETKELAVQDAIRQRDRQIKTFPAEYGVTKRALYV